MPLFGPVRSERLLDRRDEDGAGSDESQPETHEHAGSGDAAASPVIPDPIFVLGIDDIDLKPARFVDLLQYAPESPEELPAAILKRAGIPIDHLIAEMAAFPLAERAGDWLDRCRQMSLETRFTIPPDDPGRVDQLVVDEPLALRPL